MVDTIFKRCPRCGNTEVKTGLSGEIICSVCGYRSKAELPRRMSKNLKN